MCGISGIVSKKNSNNLKNRDNIIKMSNIITHRGPDQAGFLEFENIVLSHVRLPVMDPRNLGRQPMSNDNRFAIIFNGEIFNYKEIKKKLINLNYKFYSNSDTEVALNAFKEWGIKAFSLFNGDWAICFLDKLKKNLLIAKDPLGTKPLYIYEDLDYFSFCSEIKGFEAIQNIECDTDKLGLSYLTVYNFNGTKFNNINQIKPGNLLKINLETLEKKTERWFSPLNNLVPIHPSYNKNKSELFQLVYDATNLRLDADLKIGTSLSGGLDSSIIFSVLNLIDSKNILNKEIDLNPTIINYKNNLSLNDAQELANLYDRKYNIVNSKLEYSIENLVYLFSQLEIVDEYNKQIDLYNKQKSLGIDVSIDGLGPDEFLGMPSFMPQLSFTFYNNIVDINKLNENYQNQANKKLIEKYFSSMVNQKNKAILDMMNIIDMKNYFNDYIEVNNQNLLDKDFVIQDDLNELNNFNIDFQYTFFKTHCGFLQYFLHKWDKAAMASSVEIRSPFLDKNVYFYFLSLPLEKKIRKGNLKSLLRDSFEDILPDYIINQKFKQGLPIDSEVLLSNKIQNIIKELINQTNFKDFNWDINKIKKDFEDQKNIEIIWNICKYYLMIIGFKNRLKNIDNNNKLNFTTVPMLGM